LYAERILPRIIDRTCGMKSMRRLRERACAGLAGDIIEIGFGSGLNVAHYPDAVTRATVIEPSELAWKLAAGRVAAASMPVRRAGLDGQALPFGDDTFDAALSTWTLCTIPDVTAALHEVRRVLRPGATLHFLEHGLAPDPKVQRWQHRLDPIERRLAGGCTFSRPIVELVIGAGFEITELDRFYLDGPRFSGAVSLGVARTA
jgi:ubiquinone/menaquinone biosynthesis C-methylase UbiE